MLIRLNEDRWNDETQSLLEKAVQISDGKPIVVILSERVFTFLDPETEEIGKIVSRAEEKMKAALSGMPDFSYYSLPEDECGLVILKNAVITLLTKEEARWGEDVPKEGIFELLIYRQMAIEACEKGEVIAVYVPDKEQTA